MKVLNININVSQIIVKEKKVFFFCMPVLCTTKLLCRVVLAVIFLNDLLAKVVYLPKHSTTRGTLHPELRLLVPHAAVLLLVV